MKKIMKILSAAAIIIFICAIYTTTAAKRYPNDDMLIYVNYPSDYSPIANDCSGGPFTAKIVGKKICMLPYGFYLDGEKITYTYYRSQKNKYLERYNKKVVVTLSDFEYYLIRDYMRYVLESKYDPSGAMIFQGRHNIPSYCVSAYNEHDFTTSVSLYGTDFKIRFFVWFILLPLYLRHTLPPIAIIWLLYLALTKLLIKKYQIKGFSENLRFINKNCEIPIKFTFFSCGFIALTQFLLTAPAVANLLDWLCRNIILDLNESHATLGINAAGWLLFVTSQIYILMKIVKNKKAAFLAAYIFPTVILFALQWLLFYRLLGTEKFYYTNINLFLRSYIGLSEGVPIYPKVIAFTAFFAIGVILYFVFGFFANKNIRRNFAQSTAFAATNAFMCCSAVYIINFGQKILYDTSFFY